LEIWTKEGAKIVKQNKIISETMETVMNGTTIFKTKGFFGINAIA